MHNDLTPQTMVAGSVNGIHPAALSPIEAFRELFMTSDQSILPIPVSVITGFLGSGKTTLLNELIKHPAMDKVAVLVNEFGEIGLDHLLVETVTEDIVLLQSGCICCQVKDDLVNTLFDLFDKRNSGEIEAFTRVMIETTGVADPVPVIQVLISDPLLGSRFRLDGVITLVDSVFGQSQLETHDESIKQVALADRLILTKTDLVTPEELTPIKKRIQQINPSATISTVVKGDIHPWSLFDSKLFNSDTEKQRDALKWLNKEQHDTIHQHAGSTSKHCDGIASISISLDEPIDWECFGDWLDSLVFSRAENILRIKGILNVAGKDKPVVIQGVQHMFYPPSNLAEWPSTDRRSHLVFITYNFNPQAIESSLREFLAPDSMQDLSNSGESHNA